MTDPAGNRPTHQQLEAAVGAGLMDLTRLAAQIAGTRFSALSFVDGERQRFASCFGFEPLEVATCESFCPETLQTSGWFQVSDAHADPRFAQIRLVTQPPHFRFYAGLPIATPAGTPHGTLCLLDTEMGALSDAQRDSIQILARLASSQLHLRKDLEGLASRQTFLLKDSTERNLLRTLIDNLPDYVYTKDIHCRYVINNATNLKLLKAVRESDIMGKTVFDFFPADVAAAYHADDLQVLRTGQPLFNREEPFLDEQGRWRTYLTTKVPLRNVNGEIVGLVGISRDITDRKKLEAQLLRSQRMENIGRIAGGIAHDLNNVLCPIMMSIGLLQDRVTDPQCLSVLELLDRSAQRGTDMVKQVLSFARGVDGHRLPVQPRHLIKDIERFARDTFPKSIQVSANVDPKTWTVTGDATQLHQVLLNLCVNAQDAMPGGGELRLKAENLVADEQYCGLNPEAKPGRYVVLSVEDTGLGIPAEIRDEIFEPFFTTKEPGKGTGLGLSTVYAIVKNHGGFVRVTSESHLGTCFGVYLPASKSGAAPESGAGESPLPRGKGQLILVIDDEVAVRSITQQTLEAFGYCVVTAVDGTDGVARYAEQRAEIAAVVTDMVMPVMDGVATIRALRRINPELKVVAASGHASEADVARALSLGASEFITKPYTASKLLRTLEKLLEPTVQQEETPLL